MKNEALVVVVCAALAAMLGACAGTPAKRDERLRAEAESLIDSARARGVPVFRGQTRERESWEALVTAAAGADVVLIGETHDHPLGLAAASALWSDVLARESAGKNAALAMEFLERDRQVFMDDFLTGVSEEGTLVQRAYGSSASFPPGHRAMVLAAKEAGRPVIAANAPRRYVRLARLEGYDRLRGLRAEQTRMFRIPDELPGPETRYRRDFGKIMGAGEETHGPEGTAGAAENDAQRDAIDAMFRSQSLWDWTMADSVTTALSVGHSPVALVVGHFHTDFDGGLVMALRAMRPGVRVVTVCFLPEDSYPSDDEGVRADFVVCGGASKRAE